MPKSTSIGERLFCRPCLLTLKPRQLSKFCTTDMKTWLCTRNSPMKSVSCQSRLNSRKGLKLEWPNKRSRLKLRSNLALLFRLRPSLSSMMMRETNSQFPSQVPQTTPFSRFSPSCSETSTKLLTRSSRVNLLELCKKLATLTKNRPKLADLLCLELLAAGGAVSQKVEPPRWYHAPQCPLWATTQFSCTFWSEIVTTLDDGLIGIWVRRLLKITRKMLSLSMVTKSLS